MLKMSATNYTLNKLIKTAVVLIDTRERENKHITDYFDKAKIPYKTKKLEYGDYALLLPKNDEKGIPCDMLLDFAVERKHNLEELSSNFTKDRVRLEEELWRGSNKLALVIENATLDDIINNKYNTEYNNKSFIATLITFSHRYYTHIWFTEKKHSGKIIYALLKYRLREEMK